MIDGRFVKRGPTVPILARSVDIPVRSDERACPPSHERAAERWEFFAAQGYSDVAADRNVQAPDAGLASSRIAERNLICSDKNHRID